MTLKGYDTSPFKKKSDGTTVHRLKDDNNNIYYLKIYPKPDWKKFIKRTITSQLPATTASDEYRAACTLTKNHIKTLKIIAWGEKRILGIWPTKSFILSKEVKGIEAPELIKKNDSTYRLELIKAIAKITGKMHKVGIFHIYRIKDFICENHDKTNEKPILTLIDPDVKGVLLTPKPFSEDIAAQSLAHIAYLMLRSQIQFNSTLEYKIFMRIYREELKLKNINLTSNFYKALKEQLNKELSLHFQDGWKLETFPFIQNSWDQRLKFD